MLEQGEIVLVPVPFTDLSSTRRRPVIVMSNDAYHQGGEDMIVVAMTSNPKQSAYSFVITSADLTAGNLNHPGTVRADKVFTLSRSIVVKTFGKVG
jgi:mRNA-degrading endonuclease toxin of MazEF toxin-antitoxin module